MASPSPDDEHVSIDPAAPFRGIVVCCTSIPPEQRTEIANKVHELGGIHKYDLTPDATHLVVGDYDTPKYRHVARERQDVKAMDSAWVDAVSNLWKHDDDIDFLRLERAHQLKPLEKCGTDPVVQPAARQSLLICLTGFGDQRDDIAHKITSNGGRYTGDLTRRCTHLIVRSPEGKKFTSAKAWGVYTVTLDWLCQSVERGMILEEAKFDPLLPSEQQGVGAWIRDNSRRVSLGKRSRSAVNNGPEEGVRKLRKTASMKLSSQRNNLWGDILGTSTPRESLGDAQPRQAPAPPAQPLKPTPQQHEEGVFSHCVFAIHGFDRRRGKVLEETVATLGGTVCLTPEAIASDATQGGSLRRFLIVPQTSQPDTHPRIPNDDVHIVTEFYIERCMHYKRFAPPSEHVLGRPFPLFPIQGFSELTVCSAAFTGLELSQMARSVAQLGAKFEEEFRRSTTLVVCNSLQAMRKEKLRYALEWRVPVVSAEWLWECISTGFNIPFEGYIFAEIRRHYVSQKRPEPQPEKGPSKTSQTGAPETARTISRAGKARLPTEANLDATAFDRDSPEKGSRRALSRTVPQDDSTTAADFMTARTHFADTAPKKPDAPLGELSSTRLNKSPSPPKHAAAPTRTRSEQWPRSLAEKAVDVVRGPSAPPVDRSRKAAMGEAAAEEAERTARDAARKQAREAERLVLSSKLSSLIHSTADDDGREPRSQTAKVRPRRRQVLGRAISNASNASSATSADGGRPVPESLRSVAAGAADDDGGGGSDGGAASSARRGGSRTPLPPPSTQLEYRDPHVLESKAALVNKMMMRSAGGDAAATACPAAPEAADPAVAVFPGRALRKR